MESPSSRAKFPRSRKSTVNAGEITRWGAAEIARRIAAREVSAAEVTQACIARIEAVDPQLNAVVVKRFDDALRTARLCDAASARGEPLGPLHGVPMTVKECFHVAGTPSTIGVEQYRDEILHEEGLLLTRLRQAGAIILGKTNVPQLMIWHECDNPVYGRTNNPWDLERTPGGSTGGEAAIIAARGSPLGLGNDLGGSIRVPAHFCGIAGLKPTSFRLPRGGTRSTLHGMEALVSQPGPLARRVEDLALAMRVLYAPASEEKSGGLAKDQVAAYPLGDPAAVQLAGLRVAMWSDDGYFPASPAIVRAVNEAAAALRERGVIVETYRPPDVAEIVETYISLLGADGGASARRITQNSKLDWRVRRLIWLAGLSPSARGVLTTGLKMSGQRWMPRLVSLARPRSADEYWQLIDRKNCLVDRFLKSLQSHHFDAIVCPPHALPAMQHGKPIDLIAAASYAFLPNFLGLPAGVVPLTRVRGPSVANGHRPISDHHGGRSLQDAREDAARPSSRDQVERQAGAVDRGSAGLPIGVQVVGLPWREDIVLALMSALEADFQGRDDYPRKDEG